MTLCIGVDGGATKTECILVEDSGKIAARHLAGASNPNTIGADEAARTVTEALRAVRAEAPSPPAFTLLCMAGSPLFWKEFAAGLAGFGKVETGRDSLPVLELATAGAPGLVLHSGTGSFVAVRAPDGSVHYAGGLGWRFGDGGSGYDLGRRAIARALLEMQGWAPASRLAATVQRHAGMDDWMEIMRSLYGEASNAKIAALAPAVLDLAADGDQAAAEVVHSSVSELLHLARNVAGSLFPNLPLKDLRAAASGHILTHSLVRSFLAAQGSFSFAFVKEPPIEGLRRLLLRLG